MKKFDWKKKFRNKAFIVSLTTAVIAFVYQLLALLCVVPKVSQDTVLQIVMMVINLLAALGIIINPNTPGITDPEREEKYEK